MHLTKCQRCSIAIPLFLSAFLTTRTFGQAAFDEQSDYVIWAVSFPNETRLSPDQQSTVRLRVVGKGCQQAQLGEILDRVRDAYQNFGFYWARVAGTLEVLDATRRPSPVSLKLAVEEGPQYKLRQIQLQGVRVFTPEQIRSLLPMQLEEVFDTSKVREMLDGVKRLYVSAGYTDVTIVPEVKTMEHGNGLALFLTFREGSSR